MVKILRKEGFVLNPNDKQVNSLLRIMELNGGICPCQNDSEDKHCPCSNYREHDKCCCGLYVKENKIKTEKMETNLIKIINKSNNPTPECATEGSAGFDVSAFLSEDIVLKPGKRALISTGIYLAIPKGYECQVRSRSGLAIKYGITVLNSPGTIDSDYRGECKVILHNSGDEDFTIHNGDRIAQFVFAKAEKMVFEEAEELDKTERGDGGFGHTGI